MAGKTISRNDAWDILFERLCILDRYREEGSFLISADTIKTVKEPRLMTKFDNSTQLPPVFAENGLTILPVTRGDYVISDFKIFDPFPRTAIEDIEYKAIPQYIESLDFSKITSEANAIACAYLADMIADFSGDEGLVPTVSGRMGSGDFDFYIERNEHPDGMYVSVKGSQIEIDGGYEGRESLILFEAKNCISSDFLVRQLYYPFRKWTAEISKPVRTVFLVYSNGIWHMREYCFEELANYSSIRFVREKRYRLLESESVTPDVIRDVALSTPVLPEPNVPFPQADSIERVINFCELLFNNESGYTKADLGDESEFTLQDSFTHRQVDYYTNAALYLGLVEKVKIDGETAFVLSREGKRIFSLKSIVKRQVELIKSLARHRVYSVLLQEMILSGQIPDRFRVITVMKESGLRNLGTEGMYIRRSGTVRSWLRWVRSLY